MYIEYKIILLGCNVGTCCAIRSSLSMCNNVVFPALSRPRNTSLPDFLYKPENKKKNSKLYLAFLCFPIQALIWDALQYYLLYKRINILMIYFKTFHEHKVIIEMKLNTFTEFFPLLKIVVDVSHKHGETYLILIFCWKCPVIRLFSLVIT